jgi:hypothetical protein
MSGERLTMADLRAAGFCAAGVRAFCARHALDYRELLRAGLPFDVLEPIGDAMVNNLIQRLRNGR